MSDLIAITALLGALAVGVISPGASFLLVAQISATTSRRAGVMAALGMGAAAALLAIIALVGLHAVLASSAWLTVALQGFGGLYLLYLSSRIWRSSHKAFVLSSGEDDRPRGDRQSFALALLTMLSNPKATVQYGVVFAALLPHDMSLSFSTSVVALVFLLEAGWYAVVALVLSSQAPRNAYLAHQSTIDRVAAVVMAMLGVRLLIAGFSSL